MNPQPCAGGARPHGESSREGTFLEDLVPEVVEDLDVDEDAEDVAGGTTWNCMGR